MQGVPCCCLQSMCGPPHGMWEACAKLVAHLQKVAGRGISREQVDHLAGLKGLEAQRKVGHCCVQRVVCVLYVRWRV